MKTPSKEFFDRLEMIYWKEDYEKIIKWLDWNRKTSFRINTLKSDKTEIETFLDANNIDFEISAISPIAYIIDRKYEYLLKWSDIFYSGKIYVQWLASMIPPIVLEPQKWEKILDVTAAPGSKTTQIAAIMNNSWTVDAIEQNQIRFDKLNYNIKLQWVTNTKTHKIDAKHLWLNFPNNYFDKILLDAPCSAEWRINLNEEKSFWFWNIENIAKKQTLQLELLSSVIPLLKKWWMLIYSTCTLAPEENEEVINKIVNKYDDLEIWDINLEIPDSKSWITEFGLNRYNKNVTKTLRILPSSYSEWFFVAKIIKAK